MGSTQDGEADEKMTVIMKREEFATFMPEAVMKNDDASADPRVARSTARSWLNGSYGRHCKRKAGPSGCSVEVVDVASMSPRTFVPLQL